MLAPWFGGTGRFANVHSIYSILEKKKAEEAFTPSPAFPFKL